VSIIKKYKNILFTIGKLVLTTGLFYWMYSRLDIIKISHTLQDCNYYYIALAAIFFVDSRVISAYRLNEYFRCIGLDMSHKVNLKLYLMGMYYNTLLPGGIGGDAIKALAIKEMYPATIKIKKIGAAILMDRLSGLLALCLVIVVAIPFMHFEQYLDTQWLRDTLRYMPFSIGITCLSGIGIFYVLNRYVLKEALTVKYRTFGYSLVIVMQQMACFLFILEAIHQHLFQKEYLFIFNISTVLSVLPVTIGGAGLREITFLSFSQFFGINQDIAFMSALVFFVVATSIALAGVYYGFFPQKAQQD
jgi:glycosyltransferase 2 family protein